MLLDFKPKKEDDLVKHTTLSSDAMTKNIRNYNNYKVD